MDAFLTRPVSRASETAKSKPVALVEALARPCSDLVIYLTLVLSLAMDFASTGILLIYLAALTFGTLLRSVPQSFRNFTRAFRGSDTGRMYLVAAALLAVVIALSLYHHEWGETEIAVKRFIIAYIIVNFVWNYSSKLVLDAAVISALIACIVALTDVFWFGLDRAEGTTNAIRFGMMAALFSVISLAGWMFFLQQSRTVAWVYAAASFGGLVAAILSGSRSVLLGLGFMLVPVGLRLIWNWSRPRFFMLAIYVVTACVLFELNVSDLRTRLQTAVELAFTTAFSGFEEPPPEEIEPEDTSSHDRLKLTLLAADEFSTNIWFGVGNRGWADAVAKLNSDPDPDRHMTMDYNQAHNQFANDLAKGGLLRGAAGLAFLLAPFIFFLRARPFAGSPTATPALLGMIVVMGFGAFSLTESVMVLSPSAPLYCLLVFYLLGAQETRWSKPA